MTEMDIQAVLDLGRELDPSKKRMSFQSALQYVCDVLTELTEREGFVEDNEDEPFIDDDCITVGITKFNHPDGGWILGEHEYLMYGSSLLFDPEAILKALAEHVDKEDRCLGMIKAYTIQVFYHEVRHTHPVNERMLECSDVSNYNQVATSDARAHDSFEHERDADEYGLCRLIDYVEEHTHS